MVPLEQRAEYDTSVAHRHNYYEIFFFVVGGGHHDIDFNRFPIRDRSIHYVSPGQVHKVFRELDSHGYVLLFSREFYHMNLNNKHILFELPFLNNNTEHPILELEEEQFNELFDLTRKMEQEYNRKDEHREEVIRSYLNILLAQSKRHFQTKEGDGSGNDKLFHEFRILLENNYKSWHKVSEYAKALNLTEKSLSEYTKKKIGKTTLEIIHQRILLEAKRLLRYSDHSIKEIAHFLSYDDPSHFSKFFKNKVDLSPQEFRDS